MSSCVWLLCCYLLVLVLAPCFRSTVCFFGFSQIHYVYPEIKARIFSYLGIFYIRITKRNWGESKETHFI